jgi:splicing factor U2AF subunit
MGEKSLTVQRAQRDAGTRPKPVSASAPASVVPGALPGAEAIAAHMAGDASAAPPPPPQSDTPASTVVSLTEMLEVDELRDDVEYGEIMEDMREECGKFGRIESIVIPRPGSEGGDEKVPGLGKVFVRFADLDGAAAARTALHGRKFGGNVVKADFIDEQVFASRAF